MEFREALKDIVIGNNMSLSGDDWDKTILVAFGAYCADNNDMLQFQELKNILVINANFGSALLQAYLTCKKNGDDSFSLLANKIEEISEELEKNNISCFSYSYFISCYLELFKLIFKDKAFEQLEIETIAWIEPEKYDYSYNTLFTSEKTFGFGRYRASIRDFKIENGVLKKYDGKDPYVVIPPFVNSIGKAAFANNKKIKSVYIPRSVTKIGAEAFSGCEKLEAVVLSEGIKNLLADTFRECKLLKRINLNNITSIGKRCFMGCVKLEKIDVPILTKVDDEAFSYCVSLKNTDFISELTQIGGRAFENCAMNYITLEKCTYLGAQAFFRCKSVTRITLNSNIKIIGIAPFKECISVNLLNIGENSYNGFVYSLFAESLDEFNLYIKSLRCIKKDFLRNAEFEGYNCIKEIEIRKMDIIPDRAFANCKALNIVKFDTVIQAIGQSAFESCEALSDLEIEYTGDKISRKAFYRCKSLKAKNILDSVDFVGDFAFAYTDISDFDFSKSFKHFKHIGAFAFANARFPKQVDLDFRNCKVLPGAFHGVNEVSTLRLNSLSDLYHSQLHLLFDSTVSKFVKSTKIDSIIIDDSIAKQAFKNYSNIRSVEFRIYDGIILEGTFENCSSLSDVTIRGNVSSIENYAFFECSALSTLNIKYDSLTVGNYSFYNCSHISSLINISKITRFGNYSFANTNINKLKLGTNVTYIGKSAFAGCNSIDEVILPFVGCGLKETKSEAKYFGAIFGNVQMSNSNIQQIEEGKEKINYYIPKGIKSITILSEKLNAGCFNGCSFLEELHLPNILNFSEIYLKECSSLKKVVLGAALEKFSAKAIAGYISNVNFDIDSKCQNYICIDGTVITKDKKKLCYLAKGDSLSKYISSISSIGEYAILHIDEKIKIPSTVRKIESYAINCANVREISIDSVENVMKSAFYNCDSLNTITIHNTKMDNSFYGDYEQLNIDTITLSKITLKSLSGMFSRVKDIVVDKLKLCDVSILNSGFFDKVSSVKTIEIESDIKRAFAEITNSNVSYVSMCNHYYLMSNLLNKELGVVNLSLKSVNIRPDEFNGVTVENLILENVSTIYRSSFFNSTIKKLTLKNIEKIEEMAFTGSHIDELSISDANYKLVDGILYSNAELIYCFDKGLQNMVIPEFVKRVYVGAINSLSDLKQLSVLHSDIAFDKSAIVNCSNLSNVELVEIKNKNLRELFDTVSNISFIKYRGDTVKRKFFANMGALREVQLIGVSKIDALAFFGNTSLETVLGLSSVNYLGDMAFANCSAIKSIILSSACKRIGIAAFMQCISLRNVTYQIDDLQREFNFSAIDLFGEKIHPNLKVEIVGGNIPSGYFENFDANIVVSVSPKEIGDNAFKNSGLTRISLIDTEKIGESAFSASQIQSAVLPRATYIGANAFNKCSLREFLELPFLGSDINNPIPLNGLLGELNKLKLKEIKIFAGNIVSNAFENCTSLVSASLPKGIAIIPNKCFSGCSMLETIVNMDFVVSIGVRAFFNCSSLKRIEFSNVEEIEEGAFSACSKLTEVIFSSSIRRLGKNILHECNSISKLKIAFTKEVDTLEALGKGISKKLKEIQLYGDFIGEYAFKNCGELETVELSDSIRIIPAYSFADCNKLRKFIGAYNICEIGKYAFYNCSALGYVGMFAPLTTIGASAFANSGLAGKYDLSNVTEIGESAFSKTYVQSIRLGDRIKSLNAHTFEGCEVLENVDITSSIKVIDKQAFACCKALSGILLDSVNFIEEKAFYQCSQLSQISLSSLEKLGVGAFEMCSSLESVVLGDNLMIISERAFAECVKLSQINIPKYLVEIGNRAFVATMMKKAKLKMPSSLIVVGEYIFENAESPTVYATSNQISKWNPYWDLNCKGHGFFNLLKRVKVKKI